MLREAVQCIITPGGKYLLSELCVLVPVQSCKILFPHRLITAMPGWGGYLAAPQLALTAVNRTACSSILLQGRFVIFWYALELASEQIPHCQRPLHPLLLGLGTGSGFVLR